MDSFDDFLDRQRKRVRYRLTAMAQRIHDQQEELVQPDIEVRCAPGSHPCVTTGFDPRSVDNVFAD